MFSFNKVPTAKVPTSGFYVGGTTKYTGDFGLIYPIFARMMIPGDIFKINVTSFLKFMPTLNPIFHDVKYKIRAHFVPYRLIDEDFEDTITGGEDGLAPDGKFPRWNPSKAGHGLKTSVSDVVKRDSLWDFFTYPMLASDTTNHGSLVDPSSLTGGVWADEAMPLAYKLRSYNCIWNKWYRDEEKQSEIKERETESGYNSDLLRVNWQNDYFTSSALQEQRGIAPALPLTGTLPVLFRNLGTVSSNVDSGTLIASGSNASNIDVSSGTTSNYLRFGGTTDVDGKVYTDGLISTPISGSVNLGNAGTFTIPDIRFTSAVQKWMERNEECGSRYGEYLRSQYGVFPRDDRLQRPEYIGGTSVTITSSAVIQTSSAVSGSPQGNETGRLTALNKGYIGTYKAYEFGCLMLTAYVVPESSYMCQGFPAEDLITSRYEIPNPIFAHVGNVPIKLGEIYAKGYLQSGSTKGDDTVFGWQGKDDAFRIGRDVAVAGFREDYFNAWTFDRYFSDYPANDNTFVSCNPDTSVQFAVSSGPKFASYTGVDVTAIRPLPKYAIPMLF